MIKDEKIILSPKELEEAKKEAVKQYKISLFNEIDYYVNNMIGFNDNVFCHNCDDHVETDKQISKNDLESMIQEMQQREF